MVKVGVVGATGYAGAELVRLLTGHPEVELVWVGSRSNPDQPYTDLYRNFFRIVDLNCTGEELSDLCDQVDVIFTATPQGYLSGILTDEILNKTKVIDLSADFRIKKVLVYEKWYKIIHKSPQFIKEAVYGLCEINRDQTVHARLVANPGCYTTCSILTLYPLVKEGLIEEKSIIIDAKSGTSGAGRSAKVGNLFCEVNENMKAYGVATHRHTPEIEEQLGYACGASFAINFTPHLVPMNRGILVTAYADLKKQKNGVYPTQEDLQKIYAKYYGNEYFIRLLPYGLPPETRFVEGSNFVDIGYQLDERTHRVIAMGALDNLVKGAAGQAVQNMNILFGIEEQKGLTATPMFP